MKEANIKGSVGFDLSSVWKLLWCEHFGLAGIGGAECFVGCDVCGSEGGEVSGVLLWLPLVILWSIWVSGE